MAEKLLALVDGEHYPPVVRAALERAGQHGEVVAALLLGGREKLAGDPEYGVPLERVGAGGAAESMVEAARRHGATSILDLSDEPVLDETGRIALITHALAAGVGYAGADFALEPPPRRRIGVPTVAVIGSGKRVGKTAVSGHLARLLAARGDRVVVVAMGRGGSARPELVEGSDGGVGVDELLERSRAGEHAASDFLEDAALARVSAIGARRCGSGLLGTPYMSNVDEAVELALGQEPELILLEGSGAAVPPIAADRTLLVHPASSGAPGAGFGRYRLLVSDLVVATMCEAPYATPEQLAALGAGRPVVKTVLRPVPDAPLAGRRVVLFTTAPDPELMAEHLRTEYDVDVVAAFGSLSDREQLARDLASAETSRADVYLTEVKAAAIDMVAAAARDRGREVVLCNNQPQALDGEPDLDRLLLALADQAVGRG